VQQVLAITMGSITGVPVTMGDAEYVGNNAQRQLSDLRKSAKKVGSAYSSAVCRARKAGLAPPVSGVAAVWESLYLPHYGGAPSTLPDGTIVPLLPVPRTRDMELTRLHTTISRATEERDAADALASSLKQAAIDAQRDAERDRSARVRAESEAKLEQSHAVTALAQAARSSEQVRVSELALKAERAKARTGQRRWQRRQQRRLRPNSTCAAARPLMP